jgi:DNA adenine methylase
MFTETMPQAELMTNATTQLDRLVNVSSVPQRSPFRYPGGKTWLVPLVRTWLHQLAFRPRLFVEPFAGGGITGLTVAFEALADRVLMIELDQDVASVWKVILERTGNKLAQRIEEFEFNAESVVACLSSKPRSKLDTAFQTILRNRVQHGGIIAPGASLMKEGENGKGLASRWYPETLARRIRSIHAISNRIDFLQDDGLSYLRENVTKKDSVFFIDPPYTVTGRRLYSCSDLDHQELFKILAESDCQFLMTYDRSSEIETLADTYGFAYEEVLMQGRLNQRKTELVITRDRAWLKPAPLTSLPFP